MAKITVHPPIPPTTIDKFLGINEDSSGETQLKLGESPHMLNYRLTEKYKLRKREGYAKLFATLGAHPIRGMWDGKIAGSYHFLFACNGHVYEHDLDAGANTSLGAITDAATFFFAFSDKVYILNGAEYKSWDGTNFGDVAGYIPLVYTATPPAGGGAANEGINLLTGKKRQSFSGDAAATIYQLVETGITSVDKVVVDGTELTAGTGYTVDLSKGQVKPVNAADFTKGTDNIEIYWTKGTGSRSEIYTNKFAMLYGGQNDTRVFLYGDGSNRYYYSGLAAGVPSAEYFPALNYRDISSSEFAVTDIVRQYDRQIIYTNGGEAWYSYYDPITVDGETIADFPTYPLNDVIGHVAPGQAQLIENNPFSIHNGIYEWSATNVRDERNAAYVSQRVKTSLDKENLTSAITVDYESKKEYWLAIGNRVWIFNYGVNAWYRFELADNVTCFLVVEEALYFGTPAGMIMKFDEGVLTDNGSEVKARWEMGFYAFGEEWLRKFIMDMWISLKPESKTSASITYQTDHQAESPTFIAKYDIFGFASVDFANWSFFTNYNPQPFHFKIKAKKFVYFKLIIENTTATDKLTVLSINLPVRTGSKVK